MYPIWKKVLKKIYWGTKQNDVRLYAEYKLEEKPDKYAS